VENFIRYSTTFWNKRSPQELSCEDAREITTNITGFFSLLLEWAAAESGGCDA